MKHLYFIRHGLSEFNKTGKWSSSTDVPLASEGHDQAIEAGRKAKEEGLHFDLIISSPLMRALQTAEYFADEIGYPKNKILLQEQLIERDFGELEGHSHLVKATRYIFDESAIDKYKGVESLDTLQARADATLKYLKSLTQETVLVVGHGAFGRALWRSISKKPVTIRNVRFDNAELIKFI